MIKKILLTICLFFLLAGPTMAVNSSLPKFGLGFSPPANLCPVGGCSSTNIAEYISMLYYYGLTLLCVVAVVVIAFSGLQWIMAFGNPSKIKTAKNRIIDSIAGLALGLCSFLILNSINPDLVSMGVFNIGGTATIANQLPVVGGDTKSGSTDYKKDVNTPTGAYCPKSGGVAEIKKIAESFNGKIYYTLPGPNHPNDPKKGSVINGKYYYDCSFFTNKILWCAGLKSLGGYTGDIFKHPNCKPLDTSNCANMPAGAQWGWPAPSSGGSGHVLISLGNNRTADCHSSGNGRINGCYGNYDTCAQVKRYLKYGLSYCPQ